MIKVGFCVSYDWYLLKISLPIIYQHADKICLALDKQRRAWSGETFEMDDNAFYQFVRDNDPLGKIILLEDDLVDPKLNARQNCNRHRHLIAEAMGKDGWHIQVDSDEYFSDFGLFVEGLRKINPNPRFEDKPMNVCCPFYVIYKKVEDGFLMVDYARYLPEMIPMATTRPQYERARQNSFYNYYLTTPVLHQSWARDEAELWYKINNWGHSAEELEKKKTRISYFNLWKALDRYNYQHVHNIHPVKPEIWPSLYFVSADDENTLVKQFGSSQAKLPWFYLFGQNNRLVARLLFHARKLFRK